MHTSPALHCSSRRSFIRTIVCLIFLVPLHNLSAAIVVSTINEPNTSFYGYGDFVRRTAQSFTTSSESYEINSISVRTTTPLALEIRQLGAGPFGPAPGSLLATLAYDSTPVVYNSLSSEHLYTAPDGLILDPFTQYYIVLTDTNLGDDIMGRLSITNSLNLTTPAGWGVQQFTLADAAVLGGWTQSSNFDDPSRRLMFEIDATVVPEASTTLMCLFAALLLLRRNASDSVRSLK